MLIREYKLIEVEELQPAETCNGGNYGRVRLTFSNGKENKEYVATTCRCGRGCSNTYPIMKLLASKGTLRDFMYWYWKQYIEGMSFRCFIEDVEERLAQPNVDYGDWDASDEWQLDEDF